MRLRITAPNIVLALLCAMYLILYIDRVNIATAAPFIQKELGLNNGEFGLAVSAFFYPYTVFQLIGGWMGDKFGARQTLCVALILVCIATALTGLVSGLGTLFLARVALGFGEGSALPTATHAMSRWTPAGRWGFAQGITHAFARVGNFLTPPIVAALILSFSWRASYLILAGISLVWTAVWLWYFRDSPNDHAHVTPDDLAALPRKTQGDENRPVPWFALFRRIWPTTIVNFFYGWALFLFLTWIPSYFVQNFQLDIKNSVIFTSGVLFGGVVGDTLGGWISDRVLTRTGSLEAARRNVIVTGFIGAALCLLPVIAMHDIAVSTICLSAAFFFSELIVAPVWAVPMDIAPRHAGLASGMMNFGSASAGIVSPIIIGYLIDFTGGWTAPLLAVSGLLLLGAVPAFYMHPEIPFADDGERKSHTVLKPAE